MSLDPRITEDASGGSRIEKLLSVGVDLQSLISCIARVTHIS